MGLRVLKYIIIVLFIGGSYFIWRQSSVNTDYLLQIYLNSYETPYLHKVLKIMPEKERSRFVIYTLDEGDGFSLDCIKDTLFSFNPTYILLTINGKSEFLKVARQNLLSENKEIKSVNKDCESFLSSTISITVLNEYVSVATLNSEDEILNRLVTFLSDPLDNKSHKKIKSITDIKNLLIDRPQKIWIKSNWGGEEILEIDDIELSPNRKYYWLDSYGLVSFKLLLEDNSINHIDIRCVGYLGNEKLKI